MESKHWYLSKALWLAGGTLVISVLKIFGIEVGTEEMETFINGILVAIASIALIIDRFLPKKKLTL